MFTYHFDTFLRVYRLYRDGSFIGSFPRKNVLLDLFPKAREV